MQSSAILQFEKWSSEERSFRDESVNFDRKRNQIEGTLNQMRLQQKQLSNEARESVDLLGRFHRDCGLLEKEKERLLDQLQGERVKLENCVRDGETLLSQENSTKMGYQQDIQLAMKELDHVLLQQEESIVRSLLKMSTVYSLLGFLASIAVVESALITELTSALNEWTTVASIHDKCAKENQKLLVKVNSSRLRVVDILNQKESGMDIDIESVLNEMERAWYNQIDSGFDSTFNYEQMSLSQDDTSA